jgi:alpha-glucosidase
MDQQVGLINKLDAVAFRARLSEAETQLEDNIPLLLFDNHDNPRMDVRYGDGVHDTGIQRVLSTVLFLSRGASLLYYGDEIGMKTTPPTRKADVKDPIGIIGWPKEKGRDGERTPMQWNTDEQAGFTAATASLLVWYKSLIRLKKSSAAKVRGSSMMLDVENTQVLSWMRQAAGGPPVVVAVNFTAQPQTVNLSAASQKLTHLRTLLKSPEGVDPAGLDQIELAPFGVYVGELH